MKFANIKVTLSLTIVGIVASMFVACSSQITESEPQVIVVTATPTATPRPVPPTPTPDGESKQEPSTEPTVGVAAEPISASYETGTLLKGSDDGVFYLTEDGTRQHIYNWNTFLAFDFDQDDIAIVDDQVLEDIPLTGELTQLVRDAKGNLYWVAAGKLWKVNEWQEAVNQENYGGLLVTSLDNSLRTTLRAYMIFRNGMLLRADDTVYYFNRPHNVALKDANIIPVPAGLNNETDVLDVPPDVLAVYEQKSQLEQVNISLNAETTAANVRQGGSLEHEVIGVIKRGNRIVAQGRSTDGNWILIDYHGQLGWLAADLVQPTAALSLLPLDTQIAAVDQDLPQAEPAAITEKRELEPIYCNDTPIRGFGKVWGDHLDVQNTLGCSNGDEQGTQAAVQTFEHGLMLWLEADSHYSGDPVYVFFDDGNYQRFGDLGAADPEKVGTVPAGFYNVGDKFGKVYWEGTGVQVKERLGHATGEATDTAGAFQQFWNGRMFWAETLDQIFVIYDYYYYDDDDNYIRVRTWGSYEDKF